MSVFAVKCNCSCRCCIVRLCVVQLIITNLNRFNNQLTGDKALFQVDTLLAAPDVVLHPQANEVYKLTLQCVRDAVDG